MEINKETGYPMEVDPSEEVDEMWTEILESREAPAPREELVKQAIEGMEKAGEEKKKIFYVESVIE